MLGNDIVDYGLDEQKYEQPRFLNRVFTKQEQNYLTQSAHKNAYLWSLWAAKEAAYKALQRTNNQLIFSPLSLQLTANSLQDLENHLEADDIMGQIKHNNQCIEVQFNWPEKNVVHCLACCKNKVSLWPRVHHTISQVKHAKTDQHQSIAVRALAQQLLKQHHIQADISRPILTMTGYEKPGPPILIDIKTRHTLPHIISLSHHSHYLAAAICLL